MNKSLFIMLIALFSILSLNEANSCPTGFTQVSYQVRIGNCWYYVTICLQCNVAYPSKIGKEISYTQVDPNCMQVLTDKEVNDKVFNDLYSALRLNSLCGLPGPCGYSPRTWIVEEPLCFKKDINGVVQNCENSPYCEYEISLCWNAAENKFDRTTTLIGMFGIIDEICPTFWLNNPPVGECYHYYTTCPQY